MLRKKDEPTPPPEATVPAADRITSVLGDGTNYQGKISGRGGVRIEGAFNGEITLDGLLVVGTTGRVTCENLRANNVIVAGAIRGDITAIKVGDPPGPCHEISEGLPRLKAVTGHAQSRRLYFIPSELRQDARKLAASFT